jgi:hypothetical protein
MLYGVHLFFFSRAESRIEQMRSEVKVIMEKHVLPINASIPRGEPTFFRKQVIL